MNDYQKILDLLNKAFDHFNKTYAEGVLKTPVIAILSRGRKPCYGWHWSNKWKQGEEIVPEIMLSAETLDRPVENLLETLIHEMVHQHNAQFGLKDCNAQQYHNKNFKKTAETIFHLQVDKSDKKGWSITSLTDRSRADVQALIEELKVPSQFQLSRTTQITKSKKNYQIQVEEDDLKWFRELKAELGISSKELFAELRDLKETLEDTTLITEKEDEE